MDPRTTSDQMANTGTLPVTGDGSVAVTVDAGPRDPGIPDWVVEARGAMTVPGKYIAYEEGTRHVVVPVQREWTRIGRSLAADVRFDDATVSRRHALIVNQTDGTRVLDDRSLNGVYVNGRRVEWSPLKDGDHVIVGRHTLWFVDTATVGSPVAAADDAAEPALAAE